VSRAGPERRSRFTAYDAGPLARERFVAGELLLRIDSDDPATVRTIEFSAQAVSDLAERQLMALAEPFISARVDGKVRNELTAAAVIRSIGVASDLGTTSAYTWLKSRSSPEMERVTRATTPMLAAAGEVSADLCEGSQTAGHAPTLNPQVAWSSSGLDRGSNRHSDRWGAPAARPGARGRRPRRLDTRPEDRAEQAPWQPAGASSAGEPQDGVEPRRFAVASPSSRRDRY